MDAVLLDIAVLALVVLAVAASLCLDFARAVLAEFSVCGPVVPCIFDL